MATRRTRSFLVDNTTSRIFTGVSEVKDAGSDKVMAGVKQQSKSFYSKKVVSVVQRLNAPGQGLYLAASGLVTQVVLSAYVPPRGQAIIVRLRKGLTYDTSTVVGDYSLPPLQSTQSVTVSSAFSNGEQYFFDVIQSGSILRGSGLAVRLNYF